MPRRPHGGGEVAPPPVHVDHQVDVVAARVTGRLEARRVGRCAVGAELDRPVTGRHVPLDLVAHGGRIGRQLRVGAGDGHVDLLAVAAEQGGQGHAGNLRLDVPAADVDEADRGHHRPALSDREAAVVHPRPHLLGAQRIEPDDQRADRPRGPHRRPANRVRWRWPDRRRRPRWRPRRRCSHAAVTTASPTRTGRSSGTTTRRAVTEAMGTGRVYERAESALEPILISFPSRGVGVRGARCTGWPARGGHRRGERHRRRSGETLRRPGLVGRRVGRRAGRRRRDRLDRGRRVGRRQRHPCRRRARRPSTPSSTAPPSPRSTAILDIDLEDWNRTLAINLTGSLNVARAIVRAVAARRRRADPRRIGQRARTRRQVAAPTAPPRRPWSR